MKETWLYVGVFGKDLPRLGVQLENFVTTKAAIVCQLEHIFMPESMRIPKVDPIVHP